MAEHAIVAGRVLAGRYRLESKLGEGGFGTIWRAEHLVLCAPVAVKIIDRNVSADQEALERFMREARAAAALRSPHVVQILDYGVDEGLPFIAMELLEGETLAQRLTRQKRLTAAETVMVVSHVARAIGRAHDAGIIHRDLKPENVFVVHNEDAEIMKVLDFGVAKVNSADLGPKGTRTRTGSLLGTPYYMSPEQAQGNKTVDHRTDLWALGVIAFECLTGTRPFESEGLGDLVLQICVRPLPNPSELAPLPKGFDIWFQKACAREADDRFQSAREMVEALRLALGLEGRETYATLPDSDNEASVRIRVQSGQTPVVADETAATSARQRENADTVVATGTRRPAVTLGQFGTTHGPESKPQNRTALLISVGGLALLIGLGTGFVMLRPKLLPVDPVIAEQPPAPEPTAEGQAADAATAVADDAGAATSKVGATPAADTDAGVAEAGISASDAGQTAKDAGKKSDAQAKADPDKPDKPDKPEKPDKPAFDPTRDWGKTDPQPAPTPPDESKPPFMNEEP